MPPKSSEAGFLPRRAVCALRRRSGPLGTKAVAGCSLLVCMSCDPLGFSSPALRGREQNVCCSVVDVTPPGRFVDERGDCDLPLNYLSHAVGIRQNPRFCYCFPLCLTLQTRSQLLYLLYASPRGNAGILRIIAGWGVCVFIG